MLVFQKKQQLDLPVLIFTLEDLFFLNRTKRKKLKRTLVFKFSSKYARRIYLLSSMSLKGVVLGGGVVDLDFRGNIAELLTNTSDRIVEIEVGDRIAQVFFLKIEYVKFEEVDELNCTERSEKGFVSTGK